MSASRVVWLGSRLPGEAGSRFLSAAGFRVDAHGALTDALPQLAEADVIVVALGTDDGPPGRTLAPILAAAPDGAKLLAIASHPGDVVASLNAGATDAVLREGSARSKGPNDSGEVYVRVMALARAARIERQQRVEIARLRAETHRDELTGLGNRRSFGERLEQAIGYAARYGGPLALVLADLDGLKAINDARGHAAGDTALRTVAEVLRGSLRTTDHAARLGGDEFGLIMPATTAQDAAQVAERIRARLETLMLPGAMRLSASFGVAALDHPVRAVDLVASELTARADTALYAAKRSGKNRVREDSAA